MITSEIELRIGDLIERYFDESSNLDPQSNKKVALNEPCLGAEEVNALLQVALSGWITQGPRVEEFEKTYATAMGCLFGVAVNSGSSANMVALQAMKQYFQFQDGDEVIVPAATFATVPMPIIQSGLTPVYVDVERDTLNIDPNAIEEAITSRTRMIMPVHTLGLPADMERIVQIARANNLTILEDCCEAHGSMIDGKRAGSWGDCATFSFYASHNMTTGEGGMVLSNNSELDRICRSLREFGRCDQGIRGSEQFYSDDVLEDYDSRYVFSRIGYNFRMTDLTAALGLAQLEKLDDMNRKRRENASFLLNALSSKCSGFIEFSGSESPYHHTYYGFPLLLREEAPISRRIVCTELKRKKIETRPLLAGCLPDQPAFRGQPGRIVGELEVSRYLRDSLFFVGVHPKLRLEQLEYLVTSIETVMLGH